MVIVGGYNVYPREVEEILFAHADVKEAACAGVPDSYYGETVRAFVVLKPNAQCSAADLIAYCKDNLVHYKTPSRIFIVEALPPRSGRSTAFNCATSSRAALPSEAKRRHRLCRRDANPTIARRSGRGARARVLCRSSRNKKRFDVLGPDRRQMDRRVLRDFREVRSEGRR
jgi:hypothetical protein